MCEVGQSGLEGVMEERIESRFNSASDKAMEDFRIHYCNGNLVDVGLRGD